MTLKTYMSRVVGEGGGERRGVGGGGGSPARCARRHGGAPARGALIGVAALRFRHLRRTTAQLQRAAAVAGDRGDLTPGGGGGRETPLSNSTRHGRWRYPAGTWPQTPRWHAQRARQKEKVRLEWRTPIMGALAGGAWARSIGVAGPEKVTNCAAPSTRRFCATSVVYSDICSN